MNHSRKIRTTVLLVVVVFTTLITAQDAPPRIEPKDASKYRGKVATVCGRIGSIGCRQSGLTTFIFSGVPDGSVAIALPRSARSASDPRPEERYLAQGVCVTGVVTRRDGRDDIPIDDLARITIERPVTVPPFGTHAHYPCELGAEQATATRQVLPGLPPEARLRRVRGSVLIQAVIEADGSIGDMRLLQSLDPAWDQAAADTLRQWKFKPGTFNGQPAAMLFTTQFTYP